MNTQHKVQESQNLKKKAVAMLSTAIAKILLKFRLPRAEFINALDEKLVLEAKKQDPEATIVSIAVRTGIDRRAISRHIKGESPRCRPDKLAVILEDIRWTAQQFYGGKKIPKTGPFRSFQSICELRASGTLTFTAILEELVNNGNLVDLGDKIEIVEFLSISTNNNINYSQLAANQVNRVTDTIIFNSDTESLEDKYVQKTIFSTQIPPAKFDILHKDIKLKAKDYYSEITELLISYEEEVNVGTYPEYGFSFLEYTIEK